MIGAGLAPEQAPPFAAPLRFFLTAPGFLAAAGLGAMLAPEWSGGPLTPATLALTHLLTLGVLAMVMLGALTQMLPVLAGAAMPGVMPVTRLAHLGLVLGAPLLAWGLGSGTPLALVSGTLILGIGLAPFLISGGLALRRARRIDTVQAMRLAFLALSVTLLLGFGLAGWLSDALPAAWQPATPPRWLAGHALAGLAGWIGVLVMGTAWQVVPMLQVTPPYPARLTRWLTPAMALALAVALIAPAPWNDIGAAGLALGLIGFAFATLRLQARRKRKVADATLTFWRLGMTSLIGSAALFLASLPPWPLPEPAWLAAGVLFLVGFAVSVVNGMLYKIVPFLAWFHLQSQLGLMHPGKPGMKDYLPDAAARGQFRLHVAALACLAAAPFLPMLARPGGALLAASAAWTGWNLWAAARLFRRHGGRFARGPTAAPGWL